MNNKCVGYSLWNLNDEYQSKLFFYEIQTMRTIQVISLAITSLLATVCQHFLAILTHQRVEPLRLTLERHKFLLIYPEMGALPKWAENKQNEWPFSLVWS